MIFEPRAEMRRGASSERKPCDAQDQSLMREIGNAVLIAVLVLSFMWLMFREM